MVERQSQALLHVVATVDKLWSSACQRSMTIDHDPVDEAVYRCSEPCGKHTADALAVQSGLLWHFRGRNVSKTYGLSDDEIVSDMFNALHLAWIRDGRIYTARFH